MLVLAYVFGDFDGLKAGDEKRLTHVNFSFAVVKDGKGSVAHWRNGDAIRKFMKNRGPIKACLSVGGWGAGGFSPAVATAEGRERLSQSLMDIVNDYGFDGLDLDWEYPCDDMAGIEAAPEDKENYTAWVALLREKLGKDKLLTMAAGASAKCANDLELKKLAALMDYIHIMTYDMSNWSETSHHTSLYKSDISRSTYADQAIRTYHEGGVPKEKLVVGCGIYGRVYENVTGIGCPVEEGPGSFGGYVKCMERAATVGLSYDEKAEAPYFYDPTEKIFVSFDNERSIKAKVNYIKKEGLGGIMYWAYNHDDAQSTLLKAMTE
jgi:chitinase